MKYFLLKIATLFFISTFFHELAISQVKLPQDFEKQKKDEYNKSAKKETTFEQFLESEKSVLEQADLLKTGKLLLYAPRLSPSVCGNGDFESGSINPLEWQGAYSNSNGQNCHNTNPNTCTPPYCPCPPNCQFDGNAPCVNVNGFVTGIIPSTNIFNSLGHQTIVTAGADPGGTPIQTVAPFPSNNNFAVRLGSRWNGSHTAGSELLSKTFVVTAANANITFWYACVFMDPLPLPDPNFSSRHFEIERPAFAVRVRGQSGNYINGLVNLGNGLSNLVSDRNNTTMFQYDPATPSNLVDGKIIYRDWSCGKINLYSQIGNTVTIEFLNYDCRWGNHWGYTYLDNFCGSPCSNSCCPNLLNILPTHPGPISGYSYDNSIPNMNSLAPGEYTIANSLTASNICSHWNICPSNGDFLLFNGKNGQSGKTVIWQHNVSVEAWHEYKFCAKFKNLPQCCFDIKPKIDITFSIAGNDIIGEVIDETALDPCKWRELSKSMLLTSGTGIMTIKIWLYESLLGDGNDLVIDDIAFYKLPQTGSIFSSLTITPTPLYNNKYSITALANNPVPEPDCGYFWEVCEIDLSNNDCIPLTKVSNPSNWWIGSATPNTFIGYQGSSTLGGSTAGRFFTGKTYQVSLGTYCTCSGWNQTKYRFKYDVMTGFALWKL